METKPIFVHSLFRSGSTYLFNVFRRSSAGYWCYQEPLNEHLRHAARAPQRLLEKHSQHSLLLRHPGLQRPYFWEFHEVRDAMAPLFKKEMSYDWFFMRENDPRFSDISAYFQSLITAARGRPMFQCCRSFGRVAALRNTFGGTHIHLWRNPWDQWWSYQVDEYFEATTQLIFNAQNLPPVLAAVKDLCRIKNCHREEIEPEFAWAQSNPLTSRESYLAFYGLWLYSLLEIEKSANLSINIDLLSSSKAYRERVRAALATEGISGLDFGDCEIAQAKFTASDTHLFEDAETCVHGLFLDEGYRQAEIDSALSLRGSHRPGPRRQMAARVADASRVRQVVIRQLDLRASIGRETAQWKVSLGESQRHLSEREAELAEAVQIANDQREEIASGRRAAASIEAELQLARAQLRVSDSELAKARTELAAQHTELAAQHTELAAQHTELAAQQEELSRAFVKLTVQSDELLAAKRRVDRLQDGLMARDSRIEDLQRDRTHWHDIADKLNRDFHALCNSRSWRLTAPLRYSNAYLKRCARAIGARIATLTKLPSIAIRRLSTIAWRFVRARPPLEAWLTNFLARHPQANRRLRAFVSRYTDKSKRIISTSTLQPVLSAMPDIPGIRWVIYPTAVQRTYLQLMRARMMHSNGTTGQEPREDQLK